MGQVGRYTVIKKIGSGGMGYVFLAEDPLLGRNVAIKTIRADLFDGPQQLDWVRDRFVREARHLAGLSHPAIVTMYDVLEQKGVLFIVMEYVDGESLQDLLARTEGPIAQDRCVSLLRQVSAGLDYAHSRNIVHRDIKPANLLQHSSGITKITDFGIAKIVNSGTKTTIGVLGTVDYMAPEQIMAGRVDARADQFSLAVVAYRMVTGHRVFDADSFHVLSEKICFEPPPPPSKHNPRLSTAVDAVFERALAKAPEDRFGNCSEFVTAMAAALSNRVAAEAAAPGSIGPARLPQARLPERPPVSDRPAAAPAPAPVLARPVPVAKAQKVFLGLRRWELTVLAIAVTALVAGALFFYLARHRASGPAHMNTGAAYAAPWPVPATRTHMRSAISGRAALSASPSEIATR